MKFPALEWWWCGTGRMRTYATMPRDTSQVSSRPRGQELPLTKNFSVPPTQYLAGTQQTSVDQVGFPLAREVNFVQADAPQLSPCPRRHWAAYCVLACWQEAARHGKRGLIASAAELAPLHHAPGSYIFLPWFHCS